jgi:hypothetical protein
MPLTKLESATLHTLLDLIVQYRRETAVAIKKEQEARKALDDFIAGIPPDPNPAAPVRPGSGVLHRVATGR